jgi:hypothetical protein
MVRIADFFISGRDRKDRMGETENAGSGDRPEVSRVIGTCKAGMKKEVAGWHTAAGMGWKRSALCIDSANIRLQ